MIEAADPRVSSTPPAGSRSAHDLAVLPVLLAYLAVLAGAGVAAARGAPALAVILAGLAALVLANHSAALSRPTHPTLREPGRPSRPEPLLLASLALVPIFALAQAAAALRPIPAAAEPALVALVVLVGVVTVARAFELGPRDLGLRIGQWRQQALIALSGLPVGVAAFLLVGEKPFGAVGVGAAAPSTVAIVVTVAAIVEELFFRGLLAGAFLRLLQGAGIPWASVVYALPAVATGSVGVVLVLLAAGLLWSWAYARTGSILGTGLAHAIAAVVCVVVWPAVLG